MRTLVRGLRFNDAENAALCILRYPFNLTRIPGRRLV
jgi:hypothetical protein